MRKFYLLLILSLGALILNAQDMKSQLLMKKSTVQSAELNNSNQHNQTQKRTVKSGATLSNPDRNLSQTVGTTMSSKVAEQKFSVNKINNNSRSWNTNSTSKVQPESAFVEFSPEKEIVEKRNLSSKTYQNEDGSFTNMIASGPIHYQKNGQFLDINTKIVQNQNSAFPYANATNLMESYFGADASKGIKTKIADTEVLEFLNLQMYWEKNGQGVQPLTANQSNVNINGNKAVYQNLFGDISAEFIILDGKRKLNYVIPNKQSLGGVPAGADYLVFSEDIVLPAGWSHTMTDRGIVIKNQFGNKAFTYESPYAFDASNQSVIRIGENTKYSVSLMGNILSIKTKVLASWINSNEIVYPVTVDPTINVWGNSNATVDQDGYFVILGGYNWDVGSGIYSYGIFNGYSMFDVSSIPVGSTINSAVSNTSVYANTTYETNGHVWARCNLNVDTTPPGTLWDDSNGGLNSTLYWVGVPYAVTPGNYTQTLNAAALNDIQTALAQGWFTMRMQIAGDDWDLNYYEWIQIYGDRGNTTTSSTAHRPYIAVNYTAPTGYCTPITQTPEPLYINQVKFVGTLNPADIVNNSSYTNGFQDFTTLTERAVQVQNGVVNISVRTGSWRGRFKAWVDWNQNGVYEASELVYDMGDMVGGSTLFGFVVPAAQTPGDYRMRIRVNNSENLTGVESFGYDFGPCDTFGWGIRSWLYEDYGEAEDYMFTVIADCPAKVTGVNVNPGDGEKCFQGGNPFGPVTLSVSGNADAEGFNWYDSEFGGTLKQHSTSTTYAAAVSTTTTFWVTAYNGFCETIYRTPVVARVKPNASIQFEITEGEVCGFESHVKVHSSGDSEEHDLVNEKFTSGLGAFKSTWEGYNQAVANWKKENSPYKVPIPPYMSVTPAVASGQTGGPFAIAVTDVAQTANVIRYLELTNAVDASELTNLKLEYDLFYRPYAENTPTWSYLKLEVNTGSGWTEIQSITTEKGNPGKFEPQSIDMSAYQVANLKIRFKIFSYGGQGWVGDIAAIDNVRLYGDRALDTNMSWSGMAPGSIFEADCTTPYSGLSNEVCLIPNDSELENNASWQLTATATLSNGCSALGLFDIANNSKVWNPTDASDDWTLTTKWKPTTPVPTINHCVIVKKQINLNANKNGLARNVTVLPGGKLNLKANSSLKVSDYIHNDAGAADFVVEHNASLIQVNDNAINTGDITVEKEFNFSNARKEYNFVSLPVTSQNLKAIYTPNSPNVQEYNEATDYMPNTNGPYIVGKGYALKEAPGSGTQTVTAKYISVPNNGEYTFTLKRQGNGYNLIGNPYPSDLDIAKFKNNTNNTAKIATTFFFWDNRNNTIHTQMGPGYTQNQYAIYNTQVLGGNPATTAAPGAPQNGANKRIPTKLVKPGTGFIVQANPGTNNQNLIFKNEFRDKGTSPNFFGKNAEEETPEDEFYSDRYWLSMRTPSDIEVTNLVVYYEGGNNDFWEDDSEAGGGSDDIYTYAGSEQVAIQGRRPFTDDDQVKLGYRAYSAGYHTIAIEAAEGVFENQQDIYLIDHVLNKTWNLSVEPYRFLSRSGEFNNRFTVVYKPSNNQISVSDKNLVSLSKVDNSILVDSSIDRITEIEIFDLNSRPVFKKSAVNANEFKVDAQSFKNQIVIVTVKTDKGEFVSKKFVN